MRAACWRHAQLCLTRINCFIRFLQAMVAAVRASFELLGLVAMRSLYSQLFKHPRLGEGLFQEVLRLELQLQGQERLSDASLEVIHEVCWPRGTPNTRVLLG